MTRSMTILAVASLPALAIAEDLTDATEIIKKVDAAAKRVNAATYDVTLDGTGGAETLLGKATGTYSIEGWANGQPKRFHVKLEGRGGMSAEEFKLEAGGDGEMFYLIDHKKKKAYQDMDPSVLGSAANALFTGLMAEFVHSTPFSDELNGPKRELKGTKTIAGEECYEIFVEYDRGLKATWCFSKKDFLPRSRVDIRNFQGVEGGIRKVVTRLVVDPKFDDKTFKMTLPKGYEQVDDFAP